MKHQSGRYPTGVSKLAEYSVRFDEQSHESHFTNRNGAFPHEASPQRTIRVVRPGRRVSLKSQRKDLDVVRIAVTDAASDTLLRRQG
jgi:hypothetical protein